MVERKRGVWRLSRRAFLRRGARAGAGLTALALVGCGEDDAPPALEEAAPPASPRAAAPAQRAAEPTAAAAPAEQVAPAALAPRRLLVPRAACTDCRLEDPAFAALPGARAFHGVIDGAGYRMEVPDTWNGDLVLMAHGFTGFDETGNAFTRDLGFGSVLGRELLLERGIAWATSTYRDTGYVPGVGVDDLLLVKDRFRADVGVPARTVCFGASMGGATAQIMATEFPKEIVGAFALCPALGNAWVLDLAAAFHAAALWFIGAPPSSGDWRGLLAWAEALGTAGPDGALTLTPRGDQFREVVRQLSGGPRWAFEEGFAEDWVWNFQLGVTLWPEVLAAGGPPGPAATIRHDSRFGAFDTREIVYAADPATGIDVDALNAEAIRFAANPNARANPGIGVAGGRLRVPMLTMVTTGDMVTPIGLHSAYQELVHAQSDETNLVMRAVRRAGHCNFREPELLSALTGFLIWMDGGPAPAGEDLTGSLEQAGVAFTNSFEPGDPLAPVT